MFVFLLWGMPETPAVAEQPIVEASVVNADYVRTADQPISFAGFTTSFAHRAVQADLGSWHRALAYERATGRHFSSGNSNVVHSNAKGAEPELQFANNDTTLPEVTAGGIADLTAGGPFNAPAAVLEVINPAFTQPVSSTVAQTLPSTIKPNATTVPATAVAATAVPEPGTLAMFGFGLLSLSWLGRKRRR